MLRSLLTIPLLIIGKWNTTTQQFKAPIKQPQKVNYSEYFSGNYCYNQDFDFSELKTYCEENNKTWVGLDVDLETQTYNFSNMLTYQKSTYYIRSLSYGYSLTNNSIAYEMVCYDINLANYTYESVIYNNDDVTDIGGTTFIFRINEGTTINNEGQMIINALYNHTGNAFVTTYDGYYNTMNRPLTTFNVMGMLVIDNNIYVNLTNNNIGQTEDSYWYQSTYHDYTNNLWQVKVFTEKTNLTNLYFSNTMMTIESYQRLQQYGTFAYVQPAVQDYTFGEFFFSIMDAPIYYLTSLFSFELFGVNLYVALASLVTMAILIIVIKKVV